MPIENYNLFSNRRFYQTWRIINNLLLILDSIRSGDVLDETLLFGPVKRYEEVRGVHL